VNPPHIDRASLALAKQIHAKVRANAERELKKRMQSMLPTERAKLKRLLTNIKFLGDVGKATATSRVSRKLLDKWMNTPGVSWQINIALNEAQASWHCGLMADDILWRAKIEPELAKDAEVFQATGQRNRESKIIVKLVARNLKAHRWQIVQAANNGDNHFFIDLGRILSGDASAELYDKLDADIAELFVENPTMSTAKAIVELIKRGHSNVEEHTVRQRKKRLGLTKSMAANRDKNSSPTVTTDVANEGTVDVNEYSSAANSGKSGHRLRRRRPAN
jgi:hypothetical protein